VGLPGLMPMCDPSKHASPWASVPSCVLSIRTQDSGESRVVLSGWASAPSARDTEMLNANGVPC
jgi:hypothetical protein